MTDYSSLIERLEKAEGPDRELDWEIAVLVGLDVVYSKRQPGKMSTQFPFSVHAPGGVDAVPRFTRSLDAAVSLVPKGLGYCVEMFHEGNDFEAIVGKGHDTDKMGNCFSTAATALCIAALKAIKEEEDEHLDPCPECGEKLIALTSGVRCSKCDYWFCY